MKRALIAVTAWLALSAGRAAGQAVPSGAERFDRQLEQIRQRDAYGVNADVPAGRRALFDYGGYASFNYLSLDDQANANHVLRQYDLVGYARLNLDGAHEFFARGRLSLQDFAPGDSFDGDGDARRADLERAYYQFDLRRAAAAYRGAKVDDNLVVTAGRQFAYWANGLTLSQTLDGAAVEAERGPLTLALLGGVTPPRTVDFDSSRPDFEDHTRRGFYGGMATARLDGLGGQLRPFAYVLFQQDLNREEDLAGAGTRTRFGYDTYYVGAGVAGTAGDHWVYGLEVVYEGGRGLSNSFDVAGGSVVPVEQSPEPVRAYAGDARVDYLLNDDGRTRVGVEFLYASGDPDRRHTSNTFGGNRRGTDDRAFNAFGLINTGLAFAPAVSNLAVLRVGASTFPLASHPAFRNLQVGVDLFLYHKADADAPVDEPTRDSGYLGLEPDLFVNWQVRSDVTLAVRYGAFLPSSRGLFETDARQFLFVGLTFAF